MKDEIDSWNKSFQKLSPRERLYALFEKVEEKDILLTSSFGSTSAVLLHMLSKVRPGFSVYFVDTGYHFEETLTYRELVTKQLGLTLIDVRAEERKHRFTRENETWKLNQDLCCFINKVSPVDELKRRHLIWVSGLLRFQSENRQKMELFEQRPDIVKFHPVIDMKPEEVALYRQIHELPEHPLLRQGYDSIGCKHCTVKGAGRSGRWADSPKTECGLHM
ncbi:phosphoadenylyl-sulfate reductase [Nafulsella turpanensis]|uniref:phosphoadenylyl-sulfate reductase n=1 Tax=Nafulsella turpanensis TaxID=1265690 RepID=UPI00034D552B|nr:phosphoadenylyl-sulfate reductase [Nafulsella turpanensis]